MVKIRNLANRYKILKNHSVKLHNGFQNEGSDFAGQYPIFGYIIQYNIIQRHTLQHYFEGGFLMDYNIAALVMHKKWKGKLRIETAMPLENTDDLSIAYTPGVAAPCKEIAEDTALSYEYTGRGNLVAVITDGSAVLGLGDIGPEAGMPVMEGKCALFRRFGGVNAIPLCISSKNVDDIVNTVTLIAGSFGGINLEDISAPRCFEIEKRLKESCDIPIFHDDQHGTAIVVLAALMGAAEITNRNISSCRAVINGAGAAGIAIARLLISAGIGDIILCDRRGAIYSGRDGLNDIKKEMAAITNKDMKKGSLADAVAGADVFIGVSAPGVLTADMVRTMNKDAIIFAMANPNPEIGYNEAIAAGAAVVGTGRSDYPNQINNLLAFPGVFRGALDARASDINDEMKNAAALAIASIAKEDGLSREKIIPSPLDERVAKRVADAVYRAAAESGVARI